MQAAALQAACIDAIRDCSGVDAMRVYEGSSDVEVKLAAVRAMAVHSKKLLGTPALLTLIARNGLDRILDAHTQEVDFVLWAQCLLESGSCSGQ
jgi:hypothetical protein